MCGIFGLIASPGSVPLDALNHVVRKLFVHSQARGKDASGVVAVSDTQILVYKEARRATLMLKSQQFADVLAHAGRSYQDGKAFVVAGHTRMVTNGSEDDDNNNQPFVQDGLAVLHNGIIVNDAELWLRHPALQRRHEVDTEVFAALLNASMATGNSLPGAMKFAFSEVEGANTIAAIDASHEEMVLGTSNGSLYFWAAPDLGLVLFGSEEYILVQVLPLIARYLSASKPEIAQVRPDTLLSISLQRAEHALSTAAHPLSSHNRLALPRQTRQLHRSANHRGKVLAVSNAYADIERLMSSGGQSTPIRRCSRCLLPETFPFIEYDAHDVCQFCRNHRPTPLRGPGALKQLADQARRSDSRGDCLVPISGGRDSCYGLHYVKNVLGLTPVAYTYDWGFITDLARRNISRMCGAMNVEHVLVAADIRQKRDNVRKNVSAWLAKPTLSLIPLFMAGDKAFFHYATMVKRQMDLGPILFSMNWLERTGFKTGFAGVNDTASHEKTYGLTPFNQLKLISHYGYSFLSNPRYLNSTIPDTMFGFLSYYLKDKDYHSIFDFLTWDQAEIEHCIIDGYGWETSPDTSSTWRIGDGTAPFYNYIYRTVAGFSEHDTFRSNQIREGMIDRETALASIEEENRPRPESFKWYCDTVGIDAIAALKVINAMPKLST